MIHDRRWSQDRAANDPQKGPEMIFFLFIVPQAAKYKLYRR